MRASFVTALADAAQHTVEQSAEARLIAMGHAYLRFAENNMAVYGLMFGKVENMAMTKNMVHQSMQAWMQLERSVQDVVGPSRAATGAMHVWSSVHGLSMLKAERRLPPHLTLHSAEDNLLRMMVAGLTAHE